MVFDVAMAIFFWVQFWRISWQEFHANFGMSGKIALHFLAGMNSGSIPNQNDPAWNVSLQMFKRLNGLFTSNGTFKMSFIDFARESQSDGSRQSTTVIGDALEDWSFAFPGPGRSQSFLKGEAKHIPKHDVCAEPLRFFLPLANLVPAKPALV